MSAPLPLAVTMGSPAGVGADLTLSIWSNARETVPSFFMIDDPAHLAMRAAQLGLSVPIEPIGEPAEASAVFPYALPVLEEKLDPPVVPGSPDPAHAAAVTKAIERGVELALNGAVAGLVTLPIHKASLYDSGFSYPGHTEFLAHLCGTDSTPVMMLAIPGLRVVLATIHIPLADVPNQLSTDRICQTARITAAALKTDFGIAAPRLALAGLNPHAGESGALGTEEATIIAPAAEILRGEGITITDPLPADTLFHDKARASFDAVICMYHDQALIPLKTLNFMEGVNITLGLPIVRTSPDHGTAFDLAGTGRADPSSLAEALRAAEAIAHERAQAT